MHSRLSHSNHSHISMKCYKFSEWIVLFLSGSRLNHSDFTYEQMSSEHGEQEQEQEDLERENKNTKQIYKFHVL